MKAPRSSPIFRGFLLCALLASLLGSAIGITPAYAASLTVTNTNNNGAGSLRDTIANAAPGDTITFDGALSGATIRLGSTLNLSRDVTIDGSALAAQITISGDTNNDGTGDVRVFSINNAVTVTLDSLTITKGWTTNNGPGGGGIMNDGTLTIRNSTLSDSSAPFGGGIQNSGTLTVTNSTLSGNSATHGGGIGTYNSGMLTVTGSTFSGNSAVSLGGGIVNFGTSIVVVANSTFSGNSAVAGGGIENEGTLTVLNSTFSGNSSTNSGAGIYNYSTGTLHYANTIIANAASGSDCFSSGTIGTNTKNLVEDGATCSASLSGDPLLGALADNGGATKTFALLSGSSAIDAGDDATCAAALVGGLDQRGAARPQGTHCDIGAYEVAPPFIVTKAADTDDGICNADCSLREAITAANARNGPDAIYFNNNYSITLGSDLPQIEGDLTIDAQTNTIIIDGDGNAVMATSTGIKLALNHLIIQNGHEGDGGAIVSRGPLTVTNSTFIGNSALYGGGAIYNYQATLTVTNSTFIGNSAPGGGAIKNDSGTLTIINSTFSNNTATNGGALLGSYGTITLINSTFSGNSASSTTGGIYNFNGTLNYANTIIANSTGGDCFNTGTIGTNINNLVEDGSCSPSLTGDPSLVALANNGGATKTFALLAVSTAIDAGDDAICASAPAGVLDQRGIARPKGAHCDIGAYEFEHFLLVTKAADTDDGTCDADCSLREAITAANASAHGDVINFDDDYTIMLGSFLPNITQDLRIDGEINTIVIDGGSAQEVIDINARVALVNLTIQNGARSGGGAIINFGGSALSVINSTFRGNSANNTAGAIYNLGTLTIANSTFSNNSASNSGGAIKNEDGILIIANSTFDSNTVGGSGGAIINSGGPLTVTNSTFSGNSAATGGGIFSFNSTLSYANTIIANSTGGDCYIDSGTIGTNTNNLMEDGSCAASLSGDPSLGALADNGGPTQTFALLAGSTAINAGSTSACAATLVNRRDQRGVARPNGPRCDIGAYEYVDTSAPTVTAFTVPSPSSSLTVQPTAFTAADDVGVTGYMITESATPPAAGAAGWSPSVLGIYTVASDGTYTLYPWVKDAVGHVSPVFGSPATVSVDSTAPTVSSFNATSPSASLTIPITAFTASDANGVTGYMITESDTAPTAGEAGWSGAAPATYTVGSDGVYTLYPWAKDALGNVSPVFGLPAIVGVDTTAPSVTAFTVTSPSASLTISIAAFTASDVVGVTGYIITESATPPAAGAAGWSGTAPATYTVGGDGAYTLYPWAKDEAGNISPLFGSPASVSVDTNAPTVASFTATSPSTSLTIPITAFTASDAVGVTGYMITESATPPAAGAAGWSGTAPATYMVGGDGTYTLYPWAKDATGNVSPVFGSPASVSVDASAPTVVSSMRVDLNPTAVASSVDFVVTFSEAVTGVDVTDFSLTTTGSISGAVVSSVSGSGTTYTVTVSAGSGDGTLRLDVLDNDSIVDAIANSLGGAGAGNGAFTSGEAYIISLYRIYLPLVMR